jgi:hypothetical protein
MQLLLLVVLSGFIATAAFSPRPSFGSPVRTSPSIIALPLRETVSPQEPFSSSVSPDDDDDDDRFSLPWTDFQEWALRDHILKYVVSVPRKGADKPELYALWRTMTREVVELSGYPVDMLRKKYKKQLAEEPNTMSSNPGILPLLDEYEFATAGGLSGRVYGIPGVADGSKIETSSVSEVQLTLPKGYVLTDDASIVYELGTPMRNSYTTIDNVDSAIGSAQSLASGAMQTAGDMAEGALRTAASTTESASLPEDAMLVRLGASTGILLAGATAINLLSHHLTVNMFWV